MKYTLIIVFLFVLSSCVYNNNKEDLPTPSLGGSANNGLNKTTVNALASSFSPASITVSIGDTVEWINNTGFHNVNGTLTTFPSNPVPFGNAVANSPWTYIFVFTIAGTYSYQCDVHAPGMAGTIIVQ
ncbi:MAG: hypothetical protein COA97_11690 [Flavobacteriales bacterium]|nr:MAG: hypothetical protein COA97_11690 [Flavobacteriales bacterium]